MEQFDKVNRSDYGKGSNHLFDIEEYNGKNCYIPTGQNCFLKCINYLTQEKTIKMNILNL